jgi:phage-related protein
MIDFPVRVRFIVDRKQLSQATGGGVNVAGGGAASGGTGIVSGLKSQLKDLGDRIENATDPTELRELVKQQDQTRKELSKSTGVQENGFGAAVGKLAGILGVLTSLRNVLSPILDAIEYLAFLGFAELIGYIKDLVGLFGDVKDKLKDAFANAKETVTESLEAAKDKVKEAIEETGETLEEAKGRLAEAWENIKTSLLEAWESVQEAWSTVKEGLIAAWDRVQEAWEVLKERFKAIWDEYVKPAWETLKGVGERIWTEYIKPAWEYLKNVGTWVWEQLIKPGWDFLKDVGTKIWTEILKPGFDKLVDSVRSVASSIKNAISRIPVIGGAITGSKAFGGTVPQTGLYMLHAGETVSGNPRSSRPSGGNNINITVNGNMHPSIVDELANKLARELDSYARW